MVVLFTLKGEEPELVKHTHTRVCICIVLYKCEYIYLPENLEDEQTEAKLPY